MVWTKQHSASGWLTNYRTHSILNLSISNKHVFEVKALERDYFLGSLYLLSPKKDCIMLSFIVY